MTIDDLDNSGKAANNEIDWSNVSSNEEVIRLIKERNKIEEQIKAIDIWALINYELETLAEILISEFDKVLDGENGGKNFTLDWSNVSSNEEVFELIKERNKIETHIKSIDKTALTNYILETLFK